MVLQPLIEAGHKLIGETDQKILVGLIGSTLKQLLKVDNAVLYSLKEGNKEFFQINSADGPFPWKMEDLRSLLQDKGSRDCKWIIPDYATQEVDFVPAMSKIGWGSCIIVPVIRSTETFVFCVGRATSAPLLTEQDYALLIVFARQAVIALVNSRLYSQVPEPVLFPGYGQQASEPGSQNAAEGAVPYFIQQKRDVEKISSLVFRLKNDLVIDCEKRLAQNGELQVSLTPSEAIILSMLVQNYSQLVTHSEFVHRIQGYDLSNTESAKIIRPLVSRLKDKLLKVGMESEDLKNVRGAGYLLDIHTN
jgi:DNA-binding winged helix-turn-helix (wHTH) protein